MHTNNYTQYPHTYTQTFILDAINRCPALFYLFIDVDSILIGF